jgi:hypothetical protein
MRNAARVPKRWLVVAAAATTLAACNDEMPLAPEAAPDDAAYEAVAQLEAWRGLHVLRAIATLQLATVRYHDLNAALRDGFVLLHPCEERPGEGPVGAVYVHMDRLLDGRIDPRLPDALVYEPGEARARLVAVEFALPYDLWTRDRPPQFLGQDFQREDEFGVWALHVWVWRHNPEGLFAEANPRVTCGDD